MRISRRFVENSAIDGLDAYYEECRAWQGVPSIARSKGGRLFCALTSGGIYEPDPRNYSVLQYSDDDGETWSLPVLAINSKPDERVRASDLELWIAPNGALWLFWCEIPYPDGLDLPTYEQKMDMENDSEYHLLESQAKTYACFCEDPDGDVLEFSEPRLMFGAIMRNKPFVTDNGRWLFPTWITNARSYYEFFYSDDEGKTVLACERCYGRAVERAYDEPGFYKMGDGRIAVVVRTTPPLYKRMFSSDNGYSWSEPEDFMPTSSQRTCTATCRSGGAFMIMSIDKKARNGFKLTYSTDGVDFSDVMILDDRARVSYAEMVEDGDGTLYVVYDRERNNKIRKSIVTGVSESAKEILFARIPRSAWERGTVAPDTVRARVISKARIDELKNIYTEEKRW